MSCVGICFRIVLIVSILIGTHDFYTTYLLAWASALHRSDDMGNARRLEQWDGQQVQVPTLFCIMR